MAKIERKSRIIDEMRETTRGLHGAGLISKRRMGEFEVLCSRDGETCRSKTYSSRGRNH